MTNEAYWAKLANAVYHTIPKKFKADKKLSRPSTVKSVTVDKQTGQPAASLSFNGHTYRTGGSTVTSLYNDWEPTAKAEFAIGGSKIIISCSTIILMAKAMVMAKCQMLTAAPPRLKKNIRKRRLRQKPLHQQQFLAVVHLA